MFVICKGNVTILMQFWRTGYIVFALCRVIHRFLQFHLPTILGSSWYYLYFNDMEIEVYKRFYAQGQCSPC